MISERLKTTICRELDLDDFDFDDATTADQVPGWDSLSHVRIICAVEAEFGLRFKTLEILRLKKVGDLQALVDARKPAG
jgi:acyl carrier protein